jgi:hypothetical protein
MVPELLNNKNSGLRKIILPDKPTINDITYP